MKENKEVYNSRICIFCKFNETCDREQFITNKSSDKTSMLCAKYSYINNEEQTI